MIMVPAYEITELMLATGIFLLTVFFLAGWWRCRATQLELGLAHSEVQRLQSLLASAHAAGRSAHRARHVMHPIREIHRLAPMCSSCKQFRNSAGEWVKAETYLQEELDTQVTHSFCKVCAEELYGTDISGPSSGTSS